jgi:hypothetical protein
MHEPIEFSAMRARSSNSADEYLRKGPQQKLGTAKLMLIQCVQAVYTGNFAMEPLPNECLRYWEVLLVNSASQRFSAKKAKRGSDREITNPRPSCCSAMKVRVVHNRTLETS